MRLGELEKLLHASWVGAREKKPVRRVLVKGPAGVGKTYTGRHVAQSLGMDFISLSCPLLNPVKVGGYPRPPAEVGGDATHCLFDGIARAFRAAGPTVLFWDDLAMAGGETLKAILQMIQFGEIDGRKLPDCVVQAGATNDVGHGADVQGLIEPLKTRWHTIVEVEVNEEDVIQYGLATGWPAWLLAFIKNDPEVLRSHKPSKSVTVDGATPRGLEYLAEWDNMGVDDAEVWAGCIGKGQATSARAFKDLQNELPDILDIMTNPDSAPVPKNPSAQWLVSFAVSMKIGSANFGQALTYLNRLPPMFRVFSIRSAFQSQERQRIAGKLPAGHKAIHTSRDYIAYSASEEGKMLLTLK